MVLKTSPNIFSQFRDFFTNIQILPPIITTYIFHSWYGYGMLTENFLTQLCSRPKVFPGGKCKFVTSKLPTNLSLKQCLIGWMIDSHLPSKCNLKFQRLKNMSKRKKIELNSLAKLFCNT